MKSLSDRDIRERAIKWMTAEDPSMKVSNLKLEAAIRGYLAGFRDHEAQTNGLVLRGDRMAAKLEAIAQILKD